MPLNMTKQLYPAKKWIGRYGVHAHNHTPKVPGRSMWSALDIFSTLHVFTNKPIREQEIK